MDFHSNLNNYETNISNWNSLAIVVYLVLLDADEHKARL